MKCMKNEGIGILTSEETLDLGRKTTENEDQSEETKAIKRD